MAVGAVESASAEAPLAALPAATEEIIQALAKQNSSSLICTAPEATGMTSAERGNAPPAAAAEPGIVPS
jgi:hypothetical protein